MQLTPMDSTNSLLSALRFDLCRVPFIALLLAIPALLNAIPAAAQTDAGRPRYTESDWIMLPAWCLDTQDGPFGSPSFGESKIGRSRSPRSDQWTSIFGGDFWHMHHFCRGLYAERRMMRADSAKERDAAISRAIGEFQYIIENCASSMPLMPEVFLRQGDLYLKQGDRTHAADAFAAARKLKPDYWPAYTHWADELAGLGMFDTAKELISEGLRHAPGEQQLLDRQRILAERSRAARPKAAAPSRRSPDDRSTTPEAHAQP